MIWSKNLIALTAVQASNALFPLLVFPYALAVLGSDGYANVVVTETIAMFVVAVVLYSFEVDGVRRVIELEGERDRRNMSRILSGIVGARLLLFLISSPLALIVAWGINPALLPLMGCWLLLPLGYAFLPGWLCQGLEDNVFIATIIVSVRLVAVAILFVYLDAEAALLVPLVSGGLFLAASVLALVQVMRRYGIGIECPSWKDVRKLLISGKYLFAANLSVAFCRDINVLVLGIMASASEQVASYSMAEKIVKMLQAALRPVSQIFLPRLFRIIKEEKEVSRRVLKRIMALTWPQLAMLAVFFIGGGVVYVVAGDELPLLQRMNNRDEILMLVLIMSPAAFAGAANYTLGLVGLSGLGVSNYFFRAVFCVGVANLVIVSLAINYFGQQGAAVSFVVSEAILLVAVIVKYFERRS